MRRPARHTFRELGLFIVVAMLFSAASAITAASELPQPFSARFTVTAMSAEVAETHWQLKHVAGTAVWSARTSALGLMALIRNQRIEESTTLALHNQRLRPRHYAHSRRKGERNTRTEMTFDWSAGVVRGLAKNQPFEASVTPQALDPLGYLLVLRNDLSRSNGALRARYSYQIADGNRAKSYTFTVLGDAQLATPLGTFEVVKLQRRGRKHRVTTLWCARALGYLPVRIDHTEKDGDIVTILIQELSGLARR